jgi:hypothetical protein
VLLPSEETFQGSSESSRIIVGQFIRCPGTFFNENDDFVRATKIVPREKNAMKVKEALRKVTVVQMRDNHMGKRR